MPATTFAEWGEFLADKNRQRQTHTPEEDF